MPKAAYATCRGCGAKRDDVGLLSRTRLCEDCGRTRLEENIDGLHFHRGEPLKRWRRGMAACIGLTLPDDT